MTVIAHSSHETKWNGLGHRDDCHRSERRHEHRSGTSRSVVSHWHDELEYIERTERRGSGRRDTAHRRPRWWNGRWSGGGSSSPSSGPGSYSQRGGSATKSGITLSAAGTDESGVLVKSGGRLTLKSVTVSTTGSSSSSDDSSFYGLDAVS